MRVFGILKRLFRFLFIRTKPKSIPQYPAVRRVFISGPYTQGDPVINTRNAIIAGDEVAKRGHIPWIPHLNIQWHMVCPHEPDFWYEYDLKWLECCDVILRLPGESWGADREVEYARFRGIKVVESLDELE